MKAKEYQILEMAIETGVAYGLTRFFKHRDEQFSLDDLASLQDQIINGVQIEINEWFTFDRENME